MVTQHKQLVLRRDAARLNPQLDEIIALARRFHALAFQRPSDGFDIFYVVKQPDRKAELIPFRCQGLGGGDRFIGNGQRLLEQRGFRRHPAILTDSVAGYTDAQAKTST